jgi:hypothetical protein
MPNNGFQISFEGGRTHPVAVCETCGEVITNYANAGVVWDEYKEGQRAAVTVLCKSNRCLSKPPYSGRPSMEFRDFLVWIAFNSGMNSEAKIREAWKASDKINNI